MKMATLSWNCVKIQGLLFFKIIEDGERPAILKAAQQPVAVMFRADVTIVIACDIVTCAWLHSDQAFG